MITIGLQSITHKLQTGEPLNAYEQEFVNDVKRVIYCEDNELLEVFTLFTEKIAYARINENRLTLGEDETALQ